MKIFDAVVDWCRHTFQHPIVLICIVSGVFLIVFGVGGIEAIMQADKKHDPSIGLEPLITGVFFIILAVFLTYNPPKAWADFRKNNSRDPNKTNGQTSVSGKNASQQEKTVAQESSDEAGLTDIPDDFTKSYEERKNSLSQKQHQLLELIELKNNKILIDQIEQELKSINYNELYYRLEQLRLLGFINKERIGSEYAFYLSEAYKPIYKKNLPDKTKFRSPDI